MLTREIEACKRLHDHVMEESDRRRSRPGTNQPGTGSLLSHAARATIRPARFVRMRTSAIAIRTKYYYVISSTTKVLLRVAPPPSH